MRSAVTLFLGLLFACASPEERFAERIENAEKLAAAGEYEKAALEYRSALKIDPESALANERLGETLLRQADLSATYYLGEAIRIDPSRVDLAMRLARVLLVSNQTDDAAQIIEAALANHPESADVRSAQSELMLYRNDPDRALEAALKATELAPEDPGVWLQLGRVHQGRVRMAMLTDTPPPPGVRRDAIAAFERADQLANGMVMARIERARVIGMRRKNLDRAKEAFADAIELAKKQGDVGLRFVAAQAAADFAANSRRPRMRIWAIREMLEADDSRIDLWVELVRLVDQVSPGMGITFFDHLLTKRPDDVRAHMALVAYLTGANHEREALSHLNEIIDRDLGSPLPWEQLIRLQMQRGRIANARATFVRMSDEFPDDPITRRAEARIALVEGRVDEAVGILRSLTEDADSFEFQRLLALAEYRAGNLERAADAINRSLTQRRDFAPEALRLKARIHHDSGEWAATLRTLASLASRGVDLSEAESLMRARALYSLDQPERGREVLVEILAAEKPGAAAAVEFARREGGSHPDEATRHLEAALLREPANTDVLEALVAIDLRAGRTSEALARINTAVESGRARPETLLLRAHVLTKTGELERAEADALRAFEANPSLPGAVDLLYSIYKAQDRLDEARASFEEAEAAGVLHAGARLLLGRIYLNQDQVNRARETLEKVLHDDPTAAAAKNDLAYLLAKNDLDLDRATLLAEDAQRAMMKDPNAADTLGYVYLRKGLHEAALHQFQYALELNGDRPGTLASMLHFHLGLTLHALNRDAEAADAFEKALALDANFPDAGEARRQLEEARQSLGDSTSPS